MVHKCPVCRYQPIVDMQESKFYCPECGWQSQTDEMVLEQIV